MGKQYPELDPKHSDFIKRQHVFFAATATGSSRVNVSPRSTDLLRVLNANTVLYLDKTGSGNETAAHLIADGRRTIMFCAFEGPPQILRLYGRGEVIHRDSAEYAALLETWFSGKAPPGARQMVRLNFDMVQSSCGYAVPFFEFKDARPGLDRWAEAKSAEQMEDYWRTKNQTSIDGLPTGLFDKTD